MRPGKVSSYTDLELALMIFLGCFGNGSARRQSLGSRYDAAQSIVDQILRSGQVPDGGGSGAVDPEKLQQSINKCFTDVLDEIREEIVNEYESK